MANLSRLLISTGALSSTREDPRKSWEYFSMPKTRESHPTGQTLKDFFRIILNALRMP